MGECWESKIHKLNNQIKQWGLIAPLIQLIDWSVQANRISTYLLQPIVSCTFWSLYLCMYVCKYVMFVRVCICVACHLFSPNRLGSMLQDHCTLSASVTTSVLLNAILRNTVGLIQLALHQVPKIEVKSSHLCKIVFCRNELQPSMKRRWLLNLLKSRQNWVVEQIAGEDKSDFHVLWIFKVSQGQLRQIKI